jgi:cobalt-zinc-cadmium efflux system outer membrane protein
MRRAPAPRLAAAIAAGALCLTAFAFSRAAAEAPSTGNAATITLSIDDALARAMEAAPLLGASSEAIRAADGALRQAGARPNPVLTLEAEDFAGSGEFSGFGGGQYTYSLGQQIERGGKRRARRAVAGAERDIAGINAERARLGVALAVRIAFIEAASAERAHGLAKARLASLEETRQAVARRVAAAKDPATALAAAAAAQSEAQAAQARTAREQARALDELALLTGLAPGRVAIAAPWFENPPALIAAPDGELRSADLALLDSVEKRAAAAAELQRANAKQDPTLSVGLRNLQASRDAAAVFSVSMPLGVFNRNKGAIVRADAERRQATFEREAGALALARDIVRARGDLDAAAAEAEALARNVIPKAEQAHISARAGFQRGAFSYLDVAAAQTAYFAYRAKEIDALRQAHLAKAEFDRLTAALPEHSEPGND